MCGGMGRRYEFYLFVALVIAAVASFQYVHQERMLVAHDNAVERLRALFAENETEHRGLAVRSKTSGCLIRGPLPDPACTPGAVFVDADPARICVKGYSKEVRNVSVATKKKVYAEYGLAYPQAKGAYEADHLVPLELGGSNDIANLFPEPAVPVPGFHEKDLVENYLHDQVCAGRIGLAAAQYQIATDWVRIYNLLTPEDVRALMSRKY